MQKESLLFLAQHWIDLQRNSCSEALLLKAAILCAEEGLDRHACNFFRRAIHMPAGREEAAIQFVHFLKSRRLFCSAAKECAIALNAGFAGHPLLSQLDLELAKYRNLPTVSLVLPCYNDAATIQLVIRAALKQSVPINEIIVVDDCSTDESAALAAALHVKLLRTDKNSGPGVARNLGIKAARGTMIAFLDADVVPDEFWLEHLLVEMLEGGCAAVGGRLVEHFQATLADAWRSQVMGGQYAETDYDSTELHGANMLFQSVALKAVGGYREDFSRSSEDVDICRRISLLGAPIRYIHTALCQHYAPNNLQSLLGTVAAWRFGPELRRGTYNKFEDLKEKWKAVLREDMVLMNGLIEGGYGWLLYPTFLNIFWSVAFDLKVFADKHGASADEETSRALASLLNSVDLVTDSEPELRTALKADLKYPLQQLADTAGSRNCSRALAISNSFIQGEEISQIQEAKADPSFVLNQLSSLITVKGQFGTWLIEGARTSRISHDFLQQLNGRAVLIDTEHVASVRKKGKPGTPNLYMDLARERLTANRSFVLEVSPRFPSRSSEDLLAKVAGYEPEIIAVAGEGPALMESFLALSETCRPQKWEVYTSAKEAEYLENGLFTAVHKVGDAPRTA